MKTLLIASLAFALCSCASVQDHNKHSFVLPPGMDTDAQDRHNTKYNMMDSSDGSKDPTASANIWGTTY